jgi:hypothetical protein
MRMCHVRTQLYYTVTRPAVLPASTTSLLRLEASLTWQPHDNKQLALSVLGSTAGPKQHWANTPKAVTAIVPWT